MQAYDIDMLQRSAHRGLADCQGWVFGLPPGITAEQWPLDPNNGYPLMHGFTLLLPEEYRVHGPHLVALSFFATAPDHNDGGPFEVDGARAVVAAGPRHPRLHRMQDILDNDYAVILLTEEEFAGALCHPPQPLFDAGQSPDWLTIGAAASHWEHCGAVVTMPDADRYLFKLLGEKPPGDIGFNRAIRWTPRATDPNAGVPPREEWAPDKTGYQPYFYWAEEPGGIDLKTEEGRQRLDKAFQIHAWAKDHKDVHIGGTMRPVQNIPEFSPYYLEFSEDFGGYNFGGGNAQLDFRDMKLDWACG